jgi:hypothetical protein
MRTDSAKQKKAHAGKKQSKDMYKVSKGSMFFELMKMGNAGEAGKRRCGCLRFQAKYTVYAVQLGHNWETVFLRRMCI